MKSTCLEHEQVDGDVLKSETINVVGTDGSSVSSLRLLCANVYAKTSAFMSSACRTHCNIETEILPDFITTLDVTYQDMTFP